MDKQLEMDTLTAKLAQANALLHLTYSESGESFRTLNTTLQENCLWAINELVRDAYALSQKLTTR